VSEIDAYIAAAPALARERLEAVREVLLRSIPNGTEAFRYGMPAVMIDARHGLHYASWAKHLAIYPVYRGDEAFEAVVGPFRATLAAVLQRAAAEGITPLDAADALALGRVAAARR